MSSTIYYFTTAEISGIMSVFAVREGDILDDMKREPGRHSRYLPRLISVRRQRIMFLMGLELGPRVSEIIGLRWTSLDWDNRIVTIWDEKKDVARCCTMPDKIWEELRSFRDLVDLRKEQRIFPITDKTANRWIKEWARAAGIKRRVRWHMMRHTHIVQSRRAGRDWDWISQQTGDSLATLIKWYSRLSLEDRHEIGNGTRLL
jgi:integrase/recombinase XerD